MLQRVMAGLSPSARARLVEDCATTLERAGWPDQIVPRRLAEECQQPPRAVAAATGLELRGVLRQSLWSAPPLIVAMLLRSVFLHVRCPTLLRFYDAIGATREGIAVEDAEFERTAAATIFDEGVGRALATIDRSELLLLLETIAAVGHHSWRSAAQRAAARLSVDATASVALPTPADDVRQLPATRMPGLSPDEVDSSSIGGVAPVATTIEGALRDGQVAVVDDIDLGPLIAAGAPLPSDPFHLAADTNTTTVPSPTAFTPLDLLIVRTVVSTLNGMPGVLQIEDLDHLVDEMTTLNDSRERSAFHRGFLDALVGRPQRPRQGGDNDERRAWYLTGHFVGQCRQRTDDAVLASFDAMPRQDRELLARKRTEAGGEIALHMVPRLLEAGRLNEAVNWLRSHAARSLPVTVEVMGWIERHLVDGDSEGCGEMVRLCRDAVASAADLLASSEQARSAGSLGDLRRLMARALSLEGLVLRLQRNFAAAVRCYEAAIEQHAMADGNGDADRPVSFAASAAAGGLALARLSIGDLGEVRVRAHRDGETQRDAIAGVEHLLTRAASSKTPWPPALVVKAMPVVIDRRASGRDLLAAIGVLQRAAELMSVSDRPIWSRSGLKERCRLYLAFAILRQLDPQTAGPAAERVADLLRNGVDAPDELWEMALEHASAADVPAAADIAMALFDRDPGGTIRSADLPRLAAHAGFRRTLKLRFESVDGVALAPSEKALLLEHVLRGATAVATRDLSIAEWSIGELDALAMEDSVVASRLLSILADRTSWEGAIDERDCTQLQVRHLDRLGRSVELGELLQRQLHQALSAEEPVLARDLVDWLAELHLDEAVRAVRPRLEAQEREQQRRRESRPPESAPMTIGFVGGNETQRQYEEELRRRLAQHAPKLSVWFEFPGWGSNWGAVADRLAPNIADADAIVLMPMVRTELGRRVRRLAGESGTPWVACTGRGCESLARSLLQAIDVVERRRAGGVNGS